MSTSHDQTVHQPTPKERTRVWDRVEDIRFGVLTTVDAAGEMSARPLTTQEVAKEESLLFFVPLDGDVARIVGTRSAVNIIYTDSGDNFFVSLGGEASISRDAGKARALWNPMTEAWFPQGPDDPNLGILRVEVGRVEYWDSGSSSIVQFLTMAKAAITKKPPTDLGEHGDYRV